MLDAMPGDRRPQMLCVQEASCSDSQLLTVSNFRLAWVFTGGKPMGGAVKSATWHRGIIALISENRRAKWVHEYTWPQGHFHVIQLEATLSWLTRVSHQEKKTL